VKNCEAWITRQSEIRSWAARTAKAERTQRLSNS